MEAAQNPQPVDPGDGENGPGGGKGDGFAPSVWSFVTFLAGMATIVIVTIVVLATTDKLGDSAAILGIVIPAIVSLGTAAFGISVAREESKKRGEAEQQKDHAERERDEADDARDKAERDRNQTKRLSAELASQTTAGFGSLLAQIKNLGNSPSGMDGFELQALTGNVDLKGEVRGTPVDQVMPEVESIAVSGEQLAQAEAALRLAGELENK